MTTILFPTRGGPASYPNRDRVIALAAELEAKVIFMYVTDVRFLHLMMSPVLIDMEAEMEEVGEFMVAMAQEHAEAAGVQADILVSRGVFRQAVQQAIQTTGANIVALGTPSRGTGVTTPTYRQELIRELVEEMGVEVVVLDEGEIIDRFGPEHLPEEGG